MVDHSTPSTFIVVARPTIKVEGCIVEALIVKRSVKVVYLNFSEPSKNYIQKNVGKYQPYYCDTQTKKHSFSLQKLVQAAGCQ